MTWSAHNRPFFFYLQFLKLLNSLHYLDLKNYRICDEGNIIILKIYGYGRHHDSARLKYVL